jgi:hypothetical protein
MYLAIGCSDTGPAVEAKYHFLDTPGQPCCDEGRVSYYPGVGESTALRVASRRAKFIPPLETEGFLWLFCKKDVL